MPFSKLKKLENVYYPYIPEIIANNQKRKVNYKRFIKEVDFYVTCFHSQRLYDGLSVIELFHNFNSNVDFTPLHTEMKIFNKQFEVVWPPRQIQGDSKLYREIRIIEDEINKNPKVKILWNIFNRMLFDEECFNQISKEVNDIQEYNDYNIDILNEIVVSNEKNILMVLTRSVLSLMKGNLGLMMKSY